MPGDFVLVNLEGGGTFVFQFFPERIQSESRTTWEAQDVAGGTKPIFYGNRDPRRITINELWLDRTDDDESIEPDIKALFALQRELPNLGRPTALLAMWGDRQERCVLEQLTIEEQWFSAQGIPQRAKVTLQLVELQEERVLGAQTGA